MIIDLKCDYCHTRVRGAQFAGNVKNRGLALASAERALAEHQASRCDGLGSRPYKSTSQPEFQNIPRERMITYKARTTDDIYRELVSCQKSHYVFAVRESDGCEDGYKARLREQLHVEDITFFYGTIGGRVFGRDLGGRVFGRDLGAVITNVEENQAYGKKHISIMMNFVENPHYRKADDVAVEPPERSQGPVVFLHTHTGALVGVEITPAVLKEIKQAVDSYERWTNKTVDFGMPANALAVPKPTKKLLSLVFFDENGKFVRTPVDDEVFATMAAASEPVCECGAASIGSTHSRWCPKHL